MRYWPAPPSEISNLGYIFRVSVLELPSIPAGTGKEKNEWFFVMQTRLFFFLSLNQMYQVSKYGAEFIPLMRKFPLTQKATRDGQTAYINI